MRSASCIVLTDMSMRIKLATTALQNVIRLDIGVRPPTGSLTACQSKIPPRLLFFSCGSSVTCILHRSVTERCKCPTQD